jgi:hypothetical protein
VAFHCADLQGFMGNYTKVAQSMKPPACSKYARLLSISKEIVIRGEGRQSPHVQPRRDSTLLKNRQGNA